MEKISSVEMDACKAHLMPVSDCIGLSDTRKGVKDALRFIDGKQVERPSSRDYRSFHVHQ
jgi:hypothetical protein